MPGDSDLLKEAISILHGGLDPYEYGVQESYSRDNPDHEVEEPENGPPDDNMDKDDVESELSNNSRASQRFKAFIEFEIRISKYNDGLQDWNSVEAYKVAADQLKTCLEKQFKSDLLSAIQNVVATGRQPHFDPSLRNLHDLVYYLTAMNKSIEDEREASLSDTTTIHLSLANNAQHSDETRQSIKDLYEHLKVEEMSSGCSHEIMLQTMNFGKLKSIDESTRLAFNLFLSHCPSRSQQWLHQWPHQWQEALCIVENDKSDHREGGHP